MVVLLDYGCLDLLNYGCPDLLNLEKQAVAGINLVYCGVNLL